MTFVKVAPRKTYRRPSLWNNDLDRFINQVLHQSVNDLSKSSTFVKKQPLVNIHEQADGFVLELAAPGLSKKDFDLNIEKDVLTISAEKESTLKEGDTIRKSEFDYFNFKRSFRLPKTVNLESIKASYKNGVLAIHLPKKEEAKELPPRQIEIK